MQVQNVRTVLCVDINENLESMQCDPEQKWELECESAEPAGAHLDIWSSYCGCRLLYVDPYA
jgi:hypothetical protein